MVVLPQRETARVRGLQVHNQSVPEAAAGQRTAVNVQGRARRTQRGDVSITPAVSPDLMLDVTLTLLAEAPRPLKHRDRVRFHIGTSEIMGRVILLDGDAVQPGEEVLGQLHLEESATAAPQDRYALRSYSPNPDDRWRGDPGCPCWPSTGAVVRTCWSSSPSCGRYCGGRAGRAPRQRRVRRLAMV